MDVEDGFKMGYPINLIVKIKTKQQFIVFNNLCKTMHFEIMYDNDEKCQPLLEERKKIELTLNDILDDVNGKNKN